MSELYYAEMESARNQAEDAYFGARQSSDTERNRQFFRAGFERAFSPLWHRLQAINRQDEQIASLAGSALTQLHDKTVE